MTKKRPRRAKSPRPGKQPRLRETPSSNTERPAWRISELDLDGPFGWERASEDALREVHGFLSSLESMTWNEILVGGKKHHHTIAVADLSRRAQARLQDRNLDDVDEVVSLRLGARKRIFGIRDRETLALLWWDPRHDVCPAPRRHT